MQTSGKTEHQIQREYAALCDEARTLGVPVSLDDPRSPRTVTGLVAAVAGKRA